MDDKKTTKWLRQKHENKKLRENNCVKECSLREATAVQQDSETWDLLAAEVEGEI